MNTLISMSGHANAFDKPYPLIKHIKQITKQRNKSVKAVDKNSEN